MDKLDQYLIFSQVADRSSFSKVAQQFNLPRSTVSTAIQLLESDLKVRLLHRTTRHVSLTNDGTILLQRIKPFLAEAEQISQLFQSGNVEGQLTINVPSRIARRLIAPKLPEFLNQYPNFQLQLGSGDRISDLVAEGIDCVIRVGELNDCNLVQRPLGNLEVIHCASADYLQRFSTPETIEQLITKHQIVGYSAGSKGGVQAWEYLNINHQLQTIKLPYQVVTDNAENYIACAVAGLGLIQIPKYDVEHLLADKSLVQILPKLIAPKLPITVLYSHRHHRSQRLSAFIAWFEQLIQPHLC